MSERDPAELLAPLKVVAGWFADALTWESFQRMSDEDMAQALLDALTEAGYALVGPDTWTCHRCGKVHFSSADYGDHLIARAVQECPQAKTSGDADA